MLEESERGLRRTYDGFLSTKFSSCIFLKILSWTSRPESGSGMDPDLVTADPDSEKIPDLDPDLINPDPDLMSPDPKH